MKGGIEGKRGDTQIETWSQVFRTARSETLFCATKGPAAGSVQRKGGCIKSQGSIIVPPLKNLT